MNDEKILTVLVIALEVALGVWLGLALSHAIH